MSEISQTDPARKLTLAEISELIGLPINSDRKIEFNCTRCENGKAKLYENAKRTKLIIYCRDCQTDLTLDEVLAKYAKPKPEPEPEEEENPYEPPPERDEAPPRQERRQHFTRPEQPEDLRQRSSVKNINAEMSTLGCYFLGDGMLWNDPELGPAVADLTPIDFWDEKHREIFLAILQTRERGEPIDMITMDYTLRNMGKLEQVGGTAYLAALQSSEPSRRHVVHYAGIVKATAQRRVGIDRATGLIDQLQNGASNADIIRYMGEYLTPHSLFGNTSGSLPALISRDIEIVSGMEFDRRIKSAPARRWIVKGLLARKEISLWSGKVEAGKTTLMRTLCMCVMRGDDFLGRWTSPGPILYVMLDADGADLTHEEFNKLGWNPTEDPIDFLIDPVMALRPNSFDQFHQKLLALKPALVVIDPLGRFEKHDDVTDYGMTYAMARCSELAKQTDTHIAFLHHIPRGRNDEDDAATAGFGSIAIAGGCNARFVCVRKTGPIYIVKSSQGKGGGFEAFAGEQILERNEETHWITLKGPYSWKDQADAVRPQVEQAINEDGDWLTTFELHKKVKGVSQSVAGSAAKTLANEGKVQLHVTKGNRHFWGKLGLQSTMFEKRKKERDPEP